MLKVTHGGGYLKTFGLRVLKVFGLLVVFNRRLVYALLLHFKISKQLNSIFNSWFQVANSDG